jgi:hypothetical protein
MATACPLEAQARATARIALGEPDEKNSGRLDREKEVTIGLVVLAEDRLPPGFVVRERFAG